MSGVGSLGRTPYYVLTGGLAILFMFPLLWSLIASVSPQGGTKQVHGFGLGNYVTLLNYGNGAPLYFLNSVIVSTLTVALTIAISLIGGYAFARFTFPGRDLLFLLTLGILMVPLGSLLIPLYVLLNFLGQQNSLFGLALVLTLFQLPFAIFMMRISFEAVPIELEESALVDGAGTLQILRRIFLPAVRPGIVTVGLFAFLAAWNDFIAPLILINDDKKSPLPLAIATLRQQTSFTVDYGATEAGVVVMAVPCLLLFVFLQRYYVRGFMSGAVKG
ncbi:MAG TPA: carbohydrate ABC transporter permease [Candidatus Limnocylindrales bacterium]